MAIRIDISFDTKYKIDQRAIKRVVEEVLKNRGKEGEMEVSVTIVGESRMKELAKKWLMDDEVHDVMSWPLEETVSPDGVMYLGDIAVCFPKAAEQAEKSKTSVMAQICRLAEHGTLHLLGIHHD